MAENEVRQYKIAPGKHLPVNGVVRHEGEVIEIPEFAAFENRHNLTNLDGTPLEAPKPAGPVMGTAGPLRAHERVGILEKQIADKKAELEVLEGLLAEAQKQSKADQVAATKRAKEIADLQAGNAPASDAKGKK